MQWCALLDPCRLGDEAECHVQGAWCSLQLLQRRATARKEEYWTAQLQVCLGDTLLASCSVYGAKGDRQGTRCIRRLMLARMA